MNGYLFLVSALVVAATAQYRGLKQPGFQQPVQNQYQQQQQFHVGRQEQPVQQNYIPIISHIDRRDDAGQFSLQYQSGDGTVFTEQGVLKRTPDGLDNVLVKTGSYSYTSPEGVPVHIEYTADEEGFKPSGDAIPVQTVNVDQQQRQ